MTMFGLERTQMIWNKIPSMIKMPIASFYFRKHRVANALRLMTTENEPLKANSNFKLVYSWVLIPMQ
jgi:hypothetical protein